MSVSIVSRAIIIGIIILIIVLLGWAFIKRNQNSTLEPSPITPASIQSNIQKGGIFMIGPSIISSQTLIYRDINNNYYNAGTCSDCPNACAIATPIQDIVKSDCSNGTCKPVLVQSAADQISGYLKQAGKNVMTQVDCAVVLDTSGDPTSTYVNQQVMSMIVQDTSNAFVSLWDFMSDHSIQLKSLVVQYGAQVVLSDFIGEWSMIVMLLPAFLGSNAQAQYTAGVNTGVWGGKAFLDSLPRVLRWLDETKAAITPGDTILDTITTTTSAAGERAVEETVARSVSEVVETIGTVLGPVFDVVMYVQIIGMFLDIWDPCGLGNVISSDDINAIGAAFDQALWKTMLQTTGKVPVEWYADLVPDYELLCPSSDGTLTSRGHISKSTLDRLTRNSRDLEPGFKDNPTDKCSNEWLALSLAYTKQYQDSLPINALGQCVRPLSASEINDRCSSILGMEVRLNNDGVVNATVSKLKKALDYTSLQLADQNQVVANFISTWWYILVILLIVLTIIAFMI